MPVRVAVFIDGANVYRAFKTVFGWTRYSPLQLAAGLAAGRHGVRTAFYIAAVPQEMGADVYADQQRFLRRLGQQRELVVWTGRMAQADGVWHEKGVDVKIATDMVSLAYRDLYDAAILVSGDGDLAPAVQEIRRIGRIWKMPFHGAGVRGILSARAPATSRSTGSSSTAAGFHKETVMAELPPDTLNEIGVLKRRDIDIEFTRTQTIMQGASHCDFRF
jgi:uncharacterized LabA/DUF88 family protein